MLTTHLYSYQAPRLIVGAMTDLRSMCERMVAMFDTESLEEARKAFDEVDRLQRREIAQACVARCPAIARRG